MDSKTVPRDPLPSKQIDSAVFPQLFQQLVFVAVNEPLAFESKASTIFTSFDLDSVMSADIINSIKQQFPAICNQETAYAVKSFPVF